MSDTPQGDETDPIVHAYRHYIIKAYVLGFLLLVLTAIALVAGLPHLQGDYTYRGPKPRDGMPTTQQKTDAWYISITGWKHVESGQYGNRGCPAILFIPVKDCIDWEEVQTKFSFSFLSED